MMLLSTFTSFVSFKTFHTTTFLLFSTYLRLDPEKGKKANQDISSIVPGAHPWLDRKAG